MILLEQIPDDLAGKLSSEEYFADVAVTTEDKLNTAQEIAAQLAALTSKGGKTGAGVIVGAPVPDSPVPNVPGPELMLRVPITVLEQPTINRDSANNGTGKTGIQIAFKVLQTLHRWAAEQVGIFYPDPQTPWRESADFEKLGFRAIDLQLLVAVANQDITPASLPTFSCPVLTVTLANVTSGAAIYYTVDGSFPGSGNSAATLYTVPFVVTSGTTVRWAAYKTALRGSDVGHATVT